ncbi:MAG TPA: ECF-type sigma factor [Gemmataceae bacterium]|nr:ECF-type sigma factor [Gemmataceae bacterium]
MSDATRLLSAIQNGDPGAASQLLPLVYDELRRLAAQKLACENPGQTLQPTELVHEAYLRLVGGEELPGTWQGRGHFFAAAAESMRRILVERARRKRRQKRGAGRTRQELDPDQVAAPEVSEDLLALDEALTKLASSEPRVAQLVQLRYFGGLTIKQAAEVLDISTRTANADWTYARSWLLAAIRGDDV